MIDKIKIETVHPLFRYDYDTLILLKCTKKTYADQLLNGLIYLNTPQNWVDQELRGNKGQGDILEGTLITVPAHENSIFSKDLLNNKLYDHFYNNMLLFFRRKNILNMRCSCFYGLHDKSFVKTILPDGKASYDFDIPKDYFSDFTELKTREEYKKAADKEKPAVVMIRNVSEFFSRIKKVLAKIGVNESEIVIAPVEYLDKHKRLILDVPFPHELLVKDSFFSTQSEVRIIINSFNKEFSNYLKNNNNCIDIGPINDIAEIQEYYYGNMEIHRHGNTKLLYSLPEPKDSNIDDFSFSEMENLLLNAISGFVKLENNPEETETLNEKLKPITDRILKKFGVYTFIDDNNLVSFYNVSKEIFEELDKKYEKSNEIDKFKNSIEFIAKKDIDEALALCDYAEKNNDYLFGISCYLKGEIYKEKGDYNNAIKYFKAAYLNDTEPSESLNQMASIFMITKRFNDAIETYTLFEENRGYDPMIFGNKGVIYINMKQYSKAIEFFDKAIELDPNDAFYYFNKSVALFKLGMKDEALKNAKKALDLDPGNSFYLAEYEKMV